MDTELKAKWVEALRGGKYEQTHTTLKDDRGFCCLGVLCEVAGISFAPSSSGDDRQNTCAGVTGNDDPYTPIYSLVPKEIAPELWRRNDGISGHRQHSFSEIADWIEANL